MDGLQSLTALAQTIQLAHWVYQNGFSKQRSANTQYIEFLVAIQNLETNLTNIQSTVEDAKRQLDQGHFGSVQGEPWDFRSLQQIVGNCAKTVSDAERFLKSKSRFNHDSNGFVDNIIWNVEFAGEVERLRDRVAFHNMKMLMVLQPLQIKLHSELRGLIIGMHEEAMSRLDRIETLIAQTGQQPEPTLTVPKELTDRFDEGLLQSHPEFQDPLKFPLQVGMDAFIQHFKEVRGISTLGTGSYLNLMKCLWIMTRVKKSQEYELELSKGSLWRHYVYTMENKLTRECSRLVAARVPLPDVDTVLLLRQEEFQIWADKDDIFGESDMSDSSFHMTELLNLTLPVEGGPDKHNLRVLQNVDGTIQIQDTLVTISGREQSTNMHRFDAYLSKAHLIPYYAVPHSTENVWNLKFKSDRESANGMAPSFATRDDLLGFQDIITGYQTKYYRGNIEVEWDNTSRLSFRSSTKRERGKVQIWMRNKAPRGKSDDGRSDTSSCDTTSTTTPAHVDIISPIAKDRRASEHSKSSKSKDLIEPHRRDSSAAGSILSRSSYANHVTRIDIKGKVGIRMEKPEPPLMIFFLEYQSRNGVDAGNSMFSYLSIELDQDTDINNDACDCRRTPSHCQYSVIERRGKPLNARRFVSSDGLQGWNLAVMGAYPDAAATESIMRPKDIRLVKLRFETRDHLESFTRRFEDIKTMYAGRLSDYYRDLNTMPGQHVAVSNNSFIS